MNKAEILRKQASELREKIKRLEAEAKKEEEAAFVKLGAFAVDAVKGGMTIDDLKLKAIELGLLDEAGL